MEISIDKAMYQQNEKNPIQSMYQNLLGRIGIQSPSLFDALIYEKENQYILEKRDTKNYFLTNDIGMKYENKIQILGRQDSIIKVNGEKVSLTDLNLLLNRICLENKIENHFYISSKKDSRKGEKLVFYVEKNNLKYKEVLKKLNLKVRGFEKIDEVILKDNFPRTVLGKIQYQLLKDS